VLYFGNLAYNQLFIDETGSKYQDEPAEESRYRSSIWAQSCVHAELAYALQNDPSFCCKTQEEADAFERVLQTKIQSSLHQTSEVPTILYICETCTLQ